MNTPTTHQKLLNARREIDPIVKVGEGWAHQSYLDEVKKTSCSPKYKVDQRIVEYDIQCKKETGWDLFPMNSKEIKFLWEKIAAMELKLEKLIKISAP